MNLLSLESTVNDQSTEFLSPPPSPWVPRSLDWEPDMRTPEILIITGVRRCGKSSLMQMIANAHRSTHLIHYLNLDDPRLHRFEGEDFEQVYQIWLSQSDDDKRPRILCFDEPQNVSGWEKWMTHFASLKRTKVILTGSNANLFSSDLATHLTGRHRTIETFPFSFSELATSKEYGYLDLPPGRKRSTKVKQLLRQYLNFGGFPRSFIDQDPTILREYFKDIIYKDIVSRRGAGPPNAMFELGSTLMSHNTQLTNKSKLAKQMGYKQARTVTGHLQFFTDAYLCYEMRKFDPSLRKRVRSLPKFFAVDHALAKQTGFHVLETESSALENMVMLEFKRRGYETFYWSSANQYEVDIVARKQSEPICAAQVSLSIKDPKVRERELRGLARAHQELGIEELYLITLDDVAEEITIGQAKVEAFPFSSWAITTLLQ